MEAKRIYITPDVELFVFAHEVIMESDNLIVDKDWEFSNIIGEDSLR